VPVNMDPCSCRLCAALRAGLDTEPYLHAELPALRYQAPATTGSAWRMIGDDSDEPVAGVYRPVEKWREQAQEWQGQAKNATEDSGSLQN
jgi:hypothetical protein